MMILTSIFPPHTPPGKKFNMYSIFFKENAKPPRPPFEAGDLAFLSEVPVILGYGFVQFPRGSWGHHPNSFRFTPVSGEAAAGGVSENPPKLATAALKNGRVDVFQVFVSWLHEPKSCSLIHWTVFEKLKINGDWISALCCYKKYCTCILFWTSLPGHASRENLRIPISRVIAPVTMHLKSHA